MKKLLISIIIVLVLALTAVTIIQGIKVGNFQILGIQEIKKQNEKLNSQIKQATKMACTDYPETLDDLNKNLKEYINTKSSYEDMVSVSTESEVQAANQYGVYEIGMLWIELGNIAKSEGVTMDVSAKDLIALDDTATSSEVDKKYNCNLYFTATGTYAGIAGFIENIEDDSKLGFKIEDFKLTASSEGTNVLQATFTCRDIIIRGISTSSMATAQSKTEEDQSKDQNEENTIDNSISDNNTVDNTNNKGEKGNNTVQ